MLLSSLLLVPNVTHALTGQVNINGGAQVLSAQAPATVSVPINIAGSDPLNGFDIQVFADPTILSAASVSLGSVLASPSIVIECINGILVVGSTCAPQDANGVVHLGAAQIGSLTSASGVLFTINYNVVGNSAGTPISFNTGCSGTSVSGDCVTISNGSPTAVPETDLGTTFANLNDFDMTPAFASLSTPAGVPISDVISYTAKGAFSDSLTETVTGPCTLATGSVDLSFPTGSDTLTCSSATNGDFPVTVTATGFSTSISHTANIALHVGPAGFSSKLNHAGVTIPRGTSDATTIITLTGVSGFSGSVSITATGPTGITGSASPSMVTLTHDASGYSTATSTLTVNVAGSVATGVYSLAVTGGSTLSVTVPALDFSIVASPAAESVPRGGSAVSTLNLVSLGSFAGTVTLSATITPIALDSGTGVNNIVVSFLPPTVTLTAGGSGSAAFSGGTVKIGRTPNPGNTATGDYVATITATSGSISHSVTVSFNVADFVFGPSFCSGNTEVDTSPNGFFPQVFIGEQCNTFTLTTQTGANGGASAVVWTEINALGGFGTFGVDSTGVIASGDPTGPGRGTFVPELGFSVCMYQTYWGNGTLIPRSYLAANGPVVRDTDGGGCRFGGYAIPNDLEADPYVMNNPDFYQVTADALKNTLPGTYLVDVCGLTGTLINCQRITLIIVRAPHNGQIVYSHKVSIAAGGVQSFKVGVTNFATQNIYAQVTITGTGNLGDTFTVQTAIVLIAPGASANNLVATLTLTPAEIGETFTFSASVAVSATDPGALTGFSSLQAGTAHFTVSP